MTSSALEALACRARVRSGEAPIHEDDVAAVAVTALLQDWHAGKSYLLTGPELISVVDQVRAIGAAIGQDVRFEEETPAQAKARMVAEGLPEAVADTLIGYRAQSGRNPVPAVPTVQQETGRPARTFAEWAVDHTGDFS
ncbi:hypothetical protein [Saccharopolyspora sp. NPDC002376]